MLATLSRSLREGPTESVLPWRLRGQLERWTTAVAYPRMTESIEFECAAPSSATLLFGGDLALHRLSAESDLDRVLGDLLPITRAADAFVLNLETQLVSDGPNASVLGSPLRADPREVRALRFLGVRAVTCANNHCLDFGPSGLEESVSLLAANDIAVCGIRKSGTVDTTRQAVLEVAGLRLGLLGYTDDWLVGPDRTEAAAPVPHVPDSVRRDIAEIRGRADLVAVQLHWGYEWSMYPMRTHRDLARSYIDAGADLVLCHHAHVPMGIERRGRGLIAYGLGNLWFGRSARDDHPFRYASFLLRVAFSSTGRAVAEVIPVWTPPDGSLSLPPATIAERVRRGVGYLSTRLDQTDYLDRVEERLEARQGCLLVLDLAKRAAEGDTRGRLERSRHLTAPRQRDLVGSLSRRTMPLSAVAAALALARDEPDRLVSDPGHWLESLPGIAREYLDAHPQRGRIP